MANIKFTPTRKSVGFKNRSSGLQIGLTRLQEQQAREDRALENQLRQQSAADRSYASGLAEKHRFEEGVLVAKNKLEDAARQNRYDALVKFAETDVSRLKGEAEELRKQADWLADFAPKHAKNLGKLAEGSFIAYESLRAQHLWDAANKSGLIDKPAAWTDQTAKHIEIEAANELAASGKLVGPGFAKGYKSVFGSKNPGYGWSWVNHKKENTERTKQEALEGIKAMGMEYNKYSAVAYMDFFAWKELERIKVSPYSSAGKAIIQMYRGFGSDDAKYRDGVDDANDTQEILKHSTERFLSERARTNVEIMDGPTADGKTRLETVDERNRRLSTYFNNGVVAFREGTFLGEDKKILYPGIGPGSTGFDNGSSYKAYLRYIAENYSHKLTVDEFRSLSEQLYTIPTKDEKGNIIPSKEVWGTKHILKLDEEVEEFKRIKEKKRKENKNFRISAENEANLAEFEADHQAFKEDKNNYIGDQLDDNKYKIFLAGWAKKASLWTTGDEESKSVIFELNGLAKDQYNDADSFNLVARLYYSKSPDSYRRALATFNGLPAPVQKRLAPEFEKFRLIAESGYTFDGKNGNQALEARIDTVYATAQGGHGTGSNPNSRISASATKNKERMASHIRQEFFRLIKKPEYKEQINHKDAMEEAIAVVLKEFDAGAHTNKEEQGWKYNRYRRTPSEFGLGEEQELVYGADSRTGIENRIKALRKARADMSKEPEGDIPLEEYSPDTVKTIYLNNELVGTRKESLTFLLNDPRLVNSPTIKEWAQEWSKDSKIPENVKILSELTGLTTSKIMNTLAKKEGYKDFYCPAVPEDAVQKEMGDQASLPKPYNLIGSHYVEACKAQGCNPVSHEAQAFIDTKASKFEIWQTANNLDFVNGIPIDPEKAIRDGILWMDTGTPTETLASLNLQSRII